VLEPRAKPPLPPATDDAASEVSDVEVPALQPPPAEREETPATQSQEAGDNVIDQIRQLGELRDAGFITPEEFDAKKAELLTRL